MSTTHGLEGPSGTSKHLRASQLPRFGPMWRMHRVQRICKLSGLAEWKVCAWGVKEEVRCPAQVLATDYT